MLSFLLIVPLHNNIHDSTATHKSDYGLIGDTCNRSPFAFKCDSIFSWHSNNVVASTESDNVIMYDVAEAVPASY